MELATISSLLGLSRRAIEDIFDAAPIDPAQVRSPWVIGLLATLIAIACLICLGSGLLLMLHAHDDRFRSERMSATFTCRYDSSSRTIHIVPRHDISVAEDNSDSDPGYIGGFDLSLEEFVEIFDPVDEKILPGKDVDGWLDGLVKQRKVPLQLSFRIDPVKGRALFRRSRYRYPDLAEAYAGDIEPVSGTTHFTLRTLPHISLALHRFRPRYLTYHQYLTRFRFIMNPRRRAQVVYVSLMPDEKTMEFVSHSEEQEYQTTLLADYLARRLVRGTYMVRLDSRAMLMIDLRSQSNERYRAWVDDIRSDVIYFLTANSMEDRYAPLVGRVIHEKDEPIPPLAAYVREGRENALENLGRPNLSTQADDIDRNTWCEILTSAVHNRTYRIYFTPYFNIAGEEVGEPYMYLVEVAPFLARGQISGEAFFDECARFELLEPLFEGLAERIASHLPSSGRVRLVLPWKLGLIGDIIAAGFTQKLGNVDLYLAFSQYEIERYGGSRLDDAISKVNAEGIRTALLLDNRPPAIDDSTMRLFSLFLVESRFYSSPVTDMHARSNTMSTLVFLKPYGKPIALTNLGTSQETYFAIIHGVTCVSSDSLCPPSSILEPMLSQGRQTLAQMRAPRSIKKQ